MSGHPGSPPSGDCSHQAYDLSRPMASYSSAMGHEGLQFPQCVFQDPAVLVNKAPYNGLDAVQTQTFFSLPSVGGDLRYSNDTQVGDFESKAWYPFSAPEYTGPLAGTTAAIQSANMCHPIADTRGQIKMPEIKTEEDGCYEYGGGGTLPKLQPEFLDPATSFPAGVYYPPPAPWTPALWAGLSPIAAPTAVALTPPCTSSPSLSPSPTGACFGTTGFYNGAAPAPVASFPASPAVASFPASPAVASFPASPAAAPAPVASFPASPAAAPAPVASFPASPAAASSSASSPAASAPPAKAASPPVRKNRVAGDPVEEEILTTEDLEKFARRLKHRRITFGFTQADVGIALGHLYGRMFSQTTICRFEALQLSFRNMCKLKPLLNKWLNEVENSDNPQDLYKVERVVVDARKRKRRTSLDSSVRHSLELCFDKCSKPSAVEITSIAKQLGLGRDVVRVWFCNRRQKGKRLVLPVDEMGERQYGKRSRPAPPHMGSTLLPGQGYPGPGQTNGMPALYMPALHRPEVFNEQLHPEIVQHLQK